jgi:hypothetical protein
LSAASVNILDLLAEKGRHAVLEGFDEHFCLDFVFQAGKSTVIGLSRYDGTFDFPNHHRGRVPSAGTTGAFAAHR